MYGVTDFARMRTESVCIVALQGLFHGGQVVCEEV